MEVPGIISIMIGLNLVLGIFFIKELVGYIMQFKKRVRFIIQLKAIISRYAK